MREAAAPPFELDEGRIAECEGWRQLAREALAPLSRAGRPGRVNRALVRSLGDHGLLARVFDRAPPGAEPGSALDLCLMRESLARECTEAETALALQGLGGWPLRLGGSPAVVDRWLPRLRSGEAIAAFAMTEPEAGSDVGSLALRADRDGEGWRLTGEKAFISNAPEADVYAVFTRTTPGAGSKGITAFAIPGDAAGLSGTALDMLAPHAVGRLQLDGVRVGQDDVLGTVDSGMKLALMTLDHFRPSVGAFAVGMAQAALDAAVEHARTRRQFGRAIGEFQAVSHLLAECATKLEAARLLVYRAASAHDAGGGRRNTKLAAMAKLFATEVAQQVVDAAVQVHGAAALVRGHLLEHLYREVRAPRIYEGTSEIQRSIIAREMGL